MNPPERPRRETPGRRESDEILAYRVESVEKQVAIFAPTAAQVGLHEYQLHEGEKRMDTLEQGLGDAHKAAGDLLACINDVKVKVEGMSVRLTLIVGLGSLLGGGLVTLAVALITS